jgi:beta-lactamase superfamily II metal-dependent hydrolase
MRRLRFLLIGLVVLLVVVFLVRFEQTPQTTPPPTSTPIPTLTPVTPTRQVANSRSAATSPAAITPSAPFTSTHLLKAYFLDIGQGDSILLKGPDFTILIDTGRQDHNDVVPYLEDIGVQSIDILIGTHPHADHIGQFPQVLARYPVSEVWMSGDTNTTKTFEDAIEAVANSGAAYHEPRAGEVYQIGSARVEVLNPDQLTGDVNEGSVSVRILFGKIAFMFTGDAEEPTESAIIARGYELKSQILKLGHHGSDTSSSPAFLEAVQPELAIWSAGIDNTYGHPKAEVIDRLKRMGVTVLGTAINSTIIVTTDGNRYAVESLLPGAVPLPPTPTVEPTPPTATAISRNAIMRAGPGTDFDVVEQLDAGTLVTPLGRNELGNWIFAESPGGSHGWIYRSFIANVARANLPIWATPTATPISSGCRDGQVDINRASLTALQEISQVGPARARQIVQLRPFASVDDLVRVDGIAEGTLAIIKAQDLACVD